MVQPRQTDSLETAFVSGNRRASVPLQKPGDGPHAGGSASASCAVKGCTKHTSFAGFFHVGCVRWGIEGCLFSVSCCGFFAQFAITVLAQDENCLVAIHVVHCQGFGRGLMA